jgi:hypothetical protein
MNLMLANRDAISGFCATLIERLDLLEFDVDLHSAVLVQAA